MAQQLLLLKSQVRFAAPTWQFTTIKFQETNRLFWPPGVLHTYIHRDKTFISFNDNDDDVNDDKINYIFTSLAINKCTSLTLCTHPLVTL